MVWDGDDGGDAGSWKSWRRCEDFKIFDWLSLLDLSTGSEIFFGRGTAFKGVKSFPMLVAKPEGEKPFEPL